MTHHRVADFDVIIVGSGPAGVSAAFPLLDAGLRVLMIDGGRQPRVQPPHGNYLDARRTSTSQWHWMIGRDFHALRHITAASPKLRAPTHAATFEDFAEVNRIATEGVMAVGSLAPGGLSNAWGGGVACYSDEELATFPCRPAEMRRSYEIIARRIGISGGRGDDLSGLFGLDEWAQDPVAMDVMQANLLSRYARRARKSFTSEFRVGRARVAVLTHAAGDRSACTQSGFCLWGGLDRSLYTAREDLQALRARPNFSYRPGTIVERLLLDGELPGVATRNAGAETLFSRRILLAAGTLASTRLALDGIDLRTPVAMLSCPTAAFLLWLPKFLGRAHDRAFGLGQLAFSLRLADMTPAFGSLFNSTGIPVAEIARHVPLGRRLAVDLLAPLMSSCVIGNLFLPGTCSNIQLQLDARSQLQVRGGYRENTVQSMRDARTHLRGNFRRLGAMLVPGSFTIGTPGSDLHYAASLPMRTRPEHGQTGPLGELVGAHGFHVVDGACLPTLPAKSHTLTIMANADRISRRIAEELSDRDAPDVHH